MLCSQPALNAVVPYTPFRCGTTIQGSCFSVPQLDFCKQGPSFKKKKKKDCIRKREDHEEEQDGWHGTIQIKKHLDSLLWKFSYMWDKVTKRISLICAPPDSPLRTAWLSSPLSRVQSWTPSSWQSKSQKYPEIIKTWSSRRNYKIPDFLCTQVSLGKERHSLKHTLPHI